MRRISWARPVLFLALLLPIAASCGGDDPTGPTDSNLIGTWDATVIEIVSVADPAVSVELIALGGSRRLVLQDQADFGLSVGIPDNGTEFGNGTWSSTDILTLNFGDGDIQGTWQFDFDLNGDTLTLTGADVEYDFDENGTEDPAKLNLTLVRL